MQCQRKKKSFYWIFTSHSLTFQKLKFMCWYLLPCWLSFHPLTLFSMLQRKRYHTFHPIYCGSCYKIIHNTIWYLSPVRTNIMLTFASLSFVTWHHGNALKSYIRSSYLVRKIVALWWALSSIILFFFPSLPCLFNPKYWLQIE